MRRGLNLQLFPEVIKLNRMITANSSLNDEDRLRLLKRFNEAVESLKFILDQGYKHWVITFSGGKDSTTTLIVALEAALICDEQIERIDVMYSDTGIEIPSIQQYALKFIRYLQNFDRVKDLPVYYHIVRPELDKSFWVCLLGKGYPPPHQRFRWCTSRLKIYPVEKALKELIQPNKTIILTGVRFGESKSRDNRLITSCSRGGECGQGVWFQYSSRLKVGYLAPIVNWSECDVWDFLNIYAPTLKYPTQHLERDVYNGRGTRFGCWMCTVVSTDKAMEKIVKLPQWSHLHPLMQFRQKVKQLTSSPDSRERYSDGRLGRLKLEVRKQLLKELLELQAKLKIELISQKEITAIEKLWQTKPYGGNENELRQVDTF